MTPPDPAALAALLPDLPRWVEVRAALAAPGVRVTAFRPEPLAFVADDGDGMVYVVGAPPADAVRAAARHPAAGVEVIAAPESLELVAAALPGWTVDPITVHTLPPDTSLPLLEGPVQVLNAAGVEGLDLPASLRAELQAAARTGADVVAAACDGRPVAFCYAASASEAWWDVSIDTMAPYRRRGLAAQAVAAEAARQRAEGRAPVWCSAASNPASAALAARLGFVPVDRLFVLRG